MKNIRLGYIFKRIGLQGILAVAGMIGPVVLVSANLIATFSDPNYNMIRDSISSLVWTPLGWVQTLGFMAIGLFTEGFVAGLIINITKSRGFGTGAFLLVGFGFGLLLVGAFHEDHVLAQSTIEGTIHSVVASFVFSILPIAGLFLAPSLKRDLYWRKLFGYTIATSVITLVILIIIACLPDETGLFGFFERMVVAIEVIWIELMAFHLLCLNIRKTGGFEFANCSLKQVITGKEK